MNVLDADIQTLLTHIADNPQIARNIINGNCPLGATERYEHNLMREVLDHFITLVAVDLIRQTGV